MPAFDDSKLRSGFNRYFRIDTALDGALLDEAFRLRHAVYCEDLRFEPRRPDGREYDEFDAHSIHCLLRSITPPNESVGCTRIVFANPEDPELPLPFERSCAEVLDRRIIDPAKLPRDRIAEISRLAVAKRYRSRKGERQAQLSIGPDDFSGTSQPRFPYIPVGLYMGAISLAIRNDIDTLFVLTEPRLASHFARLGVDIRQIGGPIEHRGTRVPSVVDVPSVVRNMRMIMRPLWHTIDEEIARSLERR